MGSGSIDFAIGKASLLQLAGLLGRALVTGRNGLILVARPVYRRLDNIREIIVTTEKGAS